MSNSQQATLRTKRTKTARKRLSSQKRLKRKRNQSLQKIVTKMRKSLNESDPANSSGSAEANDSSCVLINDSKSSIHDLTDGETVLYIEDRCGDDNLSTTVMKDVANCIDKPEGSFGKRKRINVALSDKSQRFSPLRKKSRASNILSSTPISKQLDSNCLNISNISAVSKSSPKNKLSISQEIQNLTREIKRKDYVTIDLTSGTDVSAKSVIDLTTNSNKSRSSSVIDLDREDGECSITSSSISEAEVTVIDANKRKIDRLNEQQIAKGIALMNASEKGRLLEMITDKIFNGCKVTSTKRQTSSCKTFSPEDSYIQDMITGNIRDSIGGNVYNPGNDRNRSGLRMIVIDGSNVAMQHGMKRIFSVKGLKICIDYFLKKGHTVKAFVPQYRCQANKSSDPQLLDYLEKRGLVVYTPSRKFDDGRCISSYDDRFIVQCAAEFDGVIVSQDRYRDLVSENPKWRTTIETRLLQYTWVQDMIMFPVDPLGKDGPTLDEFLRH